MNLPNSARNDDATRATISALERKILLQKSLHEITYQIHAAQNIKQIIVDLKDGILKLFDAAMITIYVAETKHYEIYSLFLSGSTLNEIRLPINNKSIAGFVANNKRSVNIADAYNEKELKAIHEELVFDRSWDQKSGIRTRQVMAAPVLHENRLMGVAQILNKKSGQVFTMEEQSFLEDITKVLGVAFYNHYRIRKKKKSKFDYLLRHGLIRDEDLETAWEAARKRRVTIEEFLMREYKIPRLEIGSALEEFYDCPFIEFNEKRPVPYDLLQSLKEEYLRRELWVPLERISGTITILIDDPNNIVKRDMIEKLLKTRDVDYCVSLYEDIIKYINYFYQREDTVGSISDLIGKLDTDEEQDEEEEFVSESDSIIMQLVNRIINDAYQRTASDIHIEPNMNKKSLEVRFRVDGDLMHYQTLPFNYKSAIVSRIKIMANLDITERRLPQDGKINFRRGRGQEFELRVATLPTAGTVEDVVLRILAKSSILPLDAMNMSPQAYKDMIGLLEKPYGMILVVGPTGSGKTTTLHAALHHINRPELKIWTAEDPVEISQNGLRQVQVNPKIGFDFAHAMRAFLRADPDVIMVGEMRDYETAKTGVEASLTGHLLLSTLHTNSAPETIIRLLDMGIDPLNFADSLLGILAQRLVKTLCAKCAQSYHPGMEEFDELVHHYGEAYFPRLGVSYNEKLTLYRPNPRGCEVCGNTGYRGRMGIHELLVSSLEIKELIQRHANVEEIREKAIIQGMTTLLQDGIRKVLQGHTDFLQVRRVCIK